MTRDGPLEVPEELQDSLIDEIIEDTKHQFLHNAVHVPKYPHPLQRYRHNVQNGFHKALQAVMNEGHRFPTPRHYRLYPDGWEDGGYPPYEFIRSGHRGGNRELRIKLPDVIWRPRAELWAKAVCMLDNVVENTATSSESSLDDVSMSSESDN